MDRRLHTLARTLRTTRLAQPPSPAHPSRPFAARRLGSLYRPDRLSQRVEPAQSPSRRWRTSLGLSLLLHALVLALLSITWPEEKPKEKTIALQLVAAGPPKTSPVASAPEPQASHPKPTAARPRSSVPPAPTGEAPVAIAEPVPAPPSPTPVPAPRSFRDWQRANRSFLPPSRLQGAGGALGEDPMSSRGRDRCEPVPGRKPGAVYLLFDSSGSMSPIRRAQALSCAHQYAKASIGAGAIVVVANFARSTIFSQPTREMFEVEAALRAASDATATQLPTKELLPAFDLSGGDGADLVIVSDGMFATTPDILVWYRYFLEASPENRGLMYTVGTPGPRESVSRLRDIGFDVFMYEELAGP